MKTHDSLISIWMQFPGAFFRALKPLLIEQYFVYCVARLIKQKTPKLTEISRGTKFFSVHILLYNKRETTLRGGGTYNVHLTFT